MRLAHRSLARHQMERYVEEELAELSKSRVFSLDHRLANPASPQIPRRLRKCSEIQESCYRHDEE